jgi:hypothetical protein
MPVRDYIPCLAEVRAVATPKDPVDQFMDEWEKFSSPLKLVLRLISSQARKARALPPTVTTKKSMVREFMGWDGVSFVTFASVAFAFLELPYQFGKARFFFMLAGMALIVKGAHSVGEKKLARWMIAIVGAVLAGIVVNVINDWVTSLESAQIAREGQDAVTRIAQAYRPPAVTPRMAPPARIYMVFDGPPRFGERRDEKGLLLPDQNLQPGDPLGFDYSFKVNGTAPVQWYGSISRTYLRTSYDLKTQKEVVGTFDALIKKAGKENPSPSPKILVGGESRWSTSFGWDDDDQTHQVVTKSDLDAMRIGKEVAFVIIQMSYQDQGKMHHARQCSFLQPPATVPGIWHFCDAPFNSD